MRGFDGLPSLGGLFILVEWFVVGGLSIILLQLCINAKKMFLEDYRVYWIWFTIAILVTIKDFTQ